MSFNVKCPKLYGDVNFIVVKPIYCPISHAASCVECDIIPIKDLGEDMQIKKKEKK